MRCFLVTMLLALLAAPAMAQKTEPAKNAPARKPATEQVPAAKPGESGTEAAKPAEEKAIEPARPAEADEHYDVAEVAPVVTHHQITLEGKALKYTATAGRLPIKRVDGKIEAEMFFVAYTLDGQDAARRPLTFAFNGGPGSASVWLHMGAVGPKKVVMQPNGFMPAAPYRNVDNPYTALDKTDLVMVDAIGTGFSRAETLQLARKFWGVKGDIQAFGEFIRMYLTRYERWSSPLFLLGESYGTTRAAGVSGYLADNGISFNGIVLLSTVLNFETLITNKTNDEAYVLTLPTYTMIAAYHKKLAPELSQDPARMRQEVEQWAMTEYTQALNKGDALSPAERSTAIEHMARYTGLTKEFIDQANLRVDVGKFTHNLLLDQKIRVGRLDGRFSGPDPEGLLDTRFYDPSNSAILPPYTSVFNSYVRTDLGYKSDMPYNVFAFRTDADREKWDWGRSIEGFPDTAKALREAMTKNPYLKVLVMEGYYDLATPYFAANFTMDHLDLSPEYRKNISYATYDAGHMVYLDNESAAKFKKDLAGFIDKSLPPPQ